MDRTSTIPVTVQRTTNVSSGTHRYRKILTLISSLATAKAAIMLLVYLLPSTTATKFPAVDPNSSFNSLLAVFTNLWDAENYVHIAHFGYPLYSVFFTEKYYAFSPVYPALIAVGHYLTGSYLTSAFLVTNLLGFAFPLILLKLVNFRTALLMELFPTYLVYSTVAYSDTLALIFLALAFVCFFKRRYLFTGLAVAAAGLVLYDLFLAALPFLIYMLVFQKNRRVRTYLGVLVPVIVAGVSLLAAYQITTGSPFTFFYLERIVWGVRLSNPVAQVQWIMAKPPESSPITGFYTILGFTLTPIYWVVRNLLFEAFLIGGIILLTRIPDPRKWLFVMYSAIVSVPLFFVVGTPVYSIPRLMLGAFPIFIGYSMLIRRKRQIVVYAALCILASSWVILSFVYGFFA